MRSSRFRETLQLTAQRENLRELGLHTAAVRTSLLAIVISPFVEEQQAYDRLYRISTMMLLFRLLLHDPVKQDA